MSAPKKQTAVKWLEKEFVKLESTIGIHGVMYELIEQAKAMEKEQIMMAARQCHFEGVRQSAKTSEDYIAYGQQYYNETYD